MRDDEPDSALEVRILIAQLLQVVMNGGRHIHTRRSRCSRRSDVTHVLLERCHRRVDL
jgi:hypothetical protein